MMLSENKYSTLVSLTGHDVCERIQVSCSLNKMRTIAGIVAINAYSYEKLYILHLVDPVGIFHLKKLAFHFRISIYIKAIIINSLCQNTRIQIRKFKVDVITKPMLTCKHF